MKEAGLSSRRTAISGQATDDGNPLFHFPHVAVKVTALQGQPGIGDGAGTAVIDIGELIKPDRPFVDVGRPVAAVFAGDVSDDVCMGLELLIWLTTLQTEMDG